MARLIDADALKERAIRVSTVKPPHTFFKAVGTREIDKAPTIEAKPVVHGKWVKQEDYCDDEYFECSSCKEHFYFLTGTPESNGYLFCPNCGADMRERKET